ncbi:MAG: hypothetical protein U1F43_14075 [Myxococcota bacterium]
MNRLACLALAWVACDHAPVAPRDVASPDAEVDASPDGEVGASPDALGDDDAEAWDCAALELADFKVNTWIPVFENHGCIVCHRPGGIGGHSDLVLRGGDDDATVAHDLEVITAVARKEFQGESVLLLRPTDRYPDGHPGGAIIPLDSPEYQALLRFVRAAQHCPSGPSGGAPINASAP